MPGSGNRVSTSKTATRTAARRTVSPDSRPSYPSWAKTTRQKAQWDAVKRLRSSSGYKSEAQRTAESKMAASRAWQEGKRRGQGRITTAEVAAFRRRGSSTFTGD